MREPDSIAILTVGTEILEGQMIDRNSQFLSHSLFDSGIEVGRHVSVGDDRAIILNQLKDLANSHMGLIVTGGLGPTSDDFTREVIAEFVQQPLCFSNESFERLSQLLRSRGVEVRDIQKQQAFFPEHAQVFTNLAGTADGFGCLINKKPLLVLPGPPLEIRAIWTEAMPWLLKNLPHRPISKVRRTLTFLGIGESQLAEKTEALNTEYGFELGYRVHRPFVEFKVWGNNNEVARIEEFVEKVHSALNEFFWFSEGDDFLRRIPLSSFESLTLLDESKDHLFLKRFQQLESVQHHPQALAVSSCGLQPIDAILSAVKSQSNFNKSLSVAYFDIDENHAGMKVDIRWFNKTFESSECFDVSSLPLQRLKSDVLAEKAIQFLHNKIQSLTSPPSND